MARVPIVVGEGVIEAAMNSKAAEYWMRMHRSGSSRVCMGDYYLI